MTQCTSCARAPRSRPVVASARSRQRAINSQRIADAVMNATSVIAIDATKRFMDALAGVADPEEKRKIIGREFVHVFQEEAAKLPNAARRCLRRAWRVAASPTWRGRRGPGGGMTTLRTLQRRNRIMAEQPTVSEDITPDQFFEQLQFSQALTEYRQAVVHWNTL